MYRLELGVPLDLVETRHEDTRRTDDHEVACAPNPEMAHRGERLDRFPNPIPSPIIAWRCCRAIFAPKA